MIRKLSRPDGRRRRALSAWALGALLASASPALAVPSIEGLSGVVREPSAIAAIGATTYHRSTGIGGSFTYPVAKTVEGGITRDNGKMAFHAKAQLLPDSGLSPALAAGVQDITQETGKRRYFWALSKTLPGFDGVVHAGMHRDEGFTSGKKEYYAGAEAGLFAGLRLKGEYNWGRETGSAGIEFQLNPKMSVYDYELDLFGPNKRRSNVIGISFQDQF